ncbi:hypothetical protein ACFORO_25840 [Amycolatopsis halotolerans]|uniref:Uncharacterized protein n=1 Tax=Amycolatopsis halotolerans TaxID=330083 RepID=A0ABV7QP36_9PSEU
MIAFVCFSDEHRGGEEHTLTDEQTRRILTYASQDFFEEGVGCCPLVTLRLGDEAVASESHVLRYREAHRPHSVEPGRWTELPDAGTGGPC